MSYRFTLSNINVALFFMAVPSHCLYFYLCVLKDASKQK